MTDPKHTPTLGLVLPLAIIKHAGTNNAVSIRDNGGRGEWVASSDTTKADALVLACNGFDALVARVAAMQAVVNAASILEQSWNNENEEDTDTTDAELALWDAIKAYRAALARESKERG